MPAIKTTVLFSTVASLALAGSVLFNNETDADGKTLPRQETLPYKAGFMAGELKRGFDKGLEGMPPCHAPYYADVKFDPKSCGTEARQIGQRLGRNITLVTDGFKGW